MCSRRRCRVQGVLLPVLTKRQDPDNGRADSDHEVAQHEPDHRRAPGLHEGQERQAVVRRLLGRDAPALHQGERLQGVDGCIQRDGPGGQRLHQEQRPVAHSCQVGGEAQP